MLGCLQVLFSDLLINAAWSGTVRKSRWRCQRTRDDQRRFRVFSRGSMTGHMQVGQALERCRTLQLLL